MLRVFRSGKKAAAMVDSRLLFLTSTSMIRTVTKHNAARYANQVWPSFNFFSTKVQPLLLEGRESSESPKWEYEEAMGLFNSLILMKPRPPVSEFDNLLQAISSSHQHSINSRSGSIVVISLSKVMTLLGIPPSIVSLNILMDCCCCCGVGRLDLGFSVFARIYRLGLTPNDATWTTLLTGLIAQGCGKQLQRGKVGKNLIFRSVIDFIKDGDSKHLKDLINPNLIDFIKDGDDKHLKELINPNLAEKLASHKMESRAYTWLLRGLLVSSPCKIVVNNLFRELIACRNFRVSPSVYSAFGGVLCQQGMVKEANSLIFHTIEKKMLCLSHKLLNRLIQSGHRPSPYTYQRLIHAFHKENKPNKAQTISSLRDLAIYSQPITLDVSLLIDIDVYSFILDGMCKAGKLSDANQLFHSLCATGVEPSVRMYNLMIAALCKEEGMWDHTIVLLNDMERKCLKLDDSLFSTLLEKYRAQYGKGTCMIQFLAMMHRRNPKFNPDDQIRSLFQEQNTFNNFLHQTVSMD